MMCQKMEVRWQLIPYYVDSTKGKFIGGNRNDELWSEETVKNDTYNLIEK